MSLNFFDRQYQEPLMNHEKFGICDDEDGSKAYTTIDNESSWISIVTNSNSQGLIFTPIDKCIIQDAEYQGRGRCDGMLCSKKHLYLVELKNQLKGGWIPDALSQLESTIQFLMEFNKNEVDSFTHKKAFACNRKRRAFQEVDNELQLTFFRKYKFRIDIQCSIQIN